LGFFLALNEGMFQPRFYSVLFWLQVVFYLGALLGWYLENRSVKVKLLFVPYYFFIMNLSVFLGLIRYLKRSQSVNWERAKRGS
jgi:membrane protein DedA with SNARE-associated domain